VSGGSITNGWVGLRTDLYLAASGDFRTDVAPLAAAVSTRGTLWRSPLTYAYLVLLAAILVVATVLCLPLEGVWPFVAWVVALAVVGWLARQRGRIAATALDRALFRGAELHRLNPNTDHVLCSTDLLAPEPVWFSGRFVYSHRLGWGVPAGMSLARAVQISACPAGSFAPAPLPIVAHRFGLAGAGDDPVSQLLLTDGASSDNLGIEWPLRLEALARSGGAPDPPPRAIDELVVVSGAGSVRSPGARRPFSLPIVGEVASLLAVKDALTAQAAAMGGRLLATRFVAARAGYGAGAGGGGARAGSALDGGLVQLDRSPYELPRAFASGSDERARRSRAALDLLSPGEERAWKADVEANGALGSAFARIPAERAARLLRHAYVLTMVNMHVVRDYPLLPVPSLADFEKLVG